MVRGDGGEEAAGQVKHTWLSLSSQEEHLTPLGGGYINRGVTLGGWTGQSHCTLTDGRRSVTFWHWRFRPLQRPKVAAATAAAAVSLQWIKENRRRNNKKKEGLCCLRRRWSPR